MIAIRSLLHREILNALARILCRIASRLNLKLVNGVHSKGSPGQARVTNAHGGRDIYAIDVKLGDATGAAAAIDNAGARSAGTGGEVALHTGHQVFKVGSATLIRICQAALRHRERKTGVHGLFHDAADCCIGRLQIWRRCRHGNGLVCGSNGKRDIDYDG